MRPISLSFLLLAALLWQCQSKQAQPVVEAKITDLTAMVKMTHKEASDTLRADTTLPIQPSIQKTLSKEAAKSVLASLDLKEVLMADWPDNGFYGDDRYRIEFIFTSVERNPSDPSLYNITGKNRFKNTISNFKGQIQVKDVVPFYDPNLDSTELSDWHLDKIYALTGEFKFTEDSSLTTSGLFAGTFKLDIGALKDGSKSLWFYTEDTPSSASGYRFDGTWTSYKKASMVKPVIWSRDLFRFANGILEEFSYGERDVEINPKYRHLGWDSFWSGDEWWNDSPKKEQ